MSWGSSSSTPRDMTPEAFKQLQPFVAGQVRNLSGGGPAYQGPFAAGMGGAERAAFRNVQNMAFNSPVSAATDAELAKTIGGGYLTPDSNPFMQGMMDAAVRPIMTQFREGEEMDRALFTRSGQKIQHSSPFSTARAKAVEGTASAIGDATSRVANQAYQQERQNQLHAMTTASARFQNSLQALQASALPRMIEEMGIERGMAEFNRRMEMIRDVLAIGAQVSQPVIANESEQSNFSIPIQLSALRRGTTGG